MAFKLCMTVDFKAYILMLISMTLTLIENVRVLKGSSCLFFKLVLNSKRLIKYSGVKGKV